MTRTERAAQYLDRLARKAGTERYGSWPEAEWADAWGVTRAPSRQGLVREYRGLVYTFANLNARAVASQTLRLYVQTGPGQRRPKCRTAPCADRRVKAAFAGRDIEVAEVLDHPFLDLLSDATAALDGFELMELTTLFQEVEGNAYWWAPPGPLGTPAALWLIPSQHMAPLRDRVTGQVTGYEYTGGSTPRTYSLEEVIHFRYPSLRDPYGPGWSPARATWESIAYMNSQRSHEQALLDNRARPDVMFSPKGEGVGEDEADRLEDQIRQKFRRGGAGGIMVSESALEAKVLNFSPQDLQMLAVYGVTKVELANGFDVPMSLVETRDVNRANAEAGHYQHARLGVLPRCRRFEGKLNQRLLPRYDRRLFCAFDNPVPRDAVTDAALMKADLDGAVLTVNEVRRDRGLPPAPWGDLPWLSVGVAQPDQDGGQALPAAEVLDAEPAPADV